MLQAVGLWDDLKDSMKQPALLLSEETKQRLCIARLLTIEPEIILLDEPCSALDPIATMRVEELMVELKKDYTILIVTHNMQQAARASDYTGFMLLGELLEFGKQQTYLLRPGMKRQRNTSRAASASKGATIRFGDKGKRRRTNGN